VACGKKFEYNSKEYGGQSADLQGNLCKLCWAEYIELKNRLNKELTDWVNSKRSK
jgi:hypothetical protein